MLEGAYGSAVDPLLHSEEHLARSRTLCCAIDFPESKPELQGLFRWLAGCVAWLLCLPCELVHFKVHRAPCLPLASPSNSCPVSACLQQAPRRNTEDFCHTLSNQQEQDPTNLYISNLPVSMDEQELENMLKPLGHVISTRILRDANGVSRGVGFARMESTEKCEVVIQHFNGKYLKTPPGIPAPNEPLLCKFADGGQKKRQSQSKYPQNGRPWHRDGETGMALTYDPAAMQNGFYSSPYSIATNRMIAQTSITPFIAASPVSTYQVQSTSWMPHQQYVMQPTGAAVLTPAMDHTMSMQQAGMMGPLAQQMNHMSLGTTGSSTGYGVCAHSQHRIPHTLALQGIEIPNLQGANPLQIYRSVPGEHTCVVKETEACRGQGECQVPILAEKIQVPPDPRSVMSQLG
ncbi:unnamed protein product [Gadus morhua 'NCC']